MHLSLMFLSTLAGASLSAELLSAFFFRTPLLLSQATFALKMVRHFLLRLPSCLERETDELFVGRSSHCLYVAIVVALLLAFHGVGRLCTRPQLSAGHCFNRQSILWRRSDHCRKLFVDSRVMTPSLS